MSEEKNELIFFHFGEFKNKKKEEKYFQAYKEFLPIATVESAAT